MMMIRLLKIKRKIRCIFFIISRGLLLFTLTLSVCVISFWKSLYLQITGENKIEIGYMCVGIVETHQDLCFYLHSSCAYRREIVLSWSCEIQDAYDYQFSIMHNCTPLCAPCSTGADTPPLLDSCICFCGDSHTKHLWKFKNYFFLSIALKWNHLTQPTSCLVLCQDGGGASEGSAGGFGGERLGGSSGHSFSHMAGGIPHESYLLRGDPDPHPTRTSRPGGHRPACHGEFDFVPSQRLQTGESSLV